MRAVLRTFGELSITLGSIMLLFCAYLLWGTGAYTERHQVLLQQQLAQEATSPVRGDGKLDSIELGRALAMIRIPKLGVDYKYAIVEGVDAEHLRQGPGHYPGTALPGEIGNFVVSGHRTTYSAPFNRIGELRPGDEVIIDARQARYTYRVTSSKIVYPTQLDVIEPVPEQPGKRARHALLTLSTCHPEYSARQRLIVYGVLDRTHERRT
ncbi:class E sortase [Acrocarpospora phusangensis]|uniref:Class E sortase n=1 Tax=Acrocarpospora phusangensis TaxID=1070424 RepID=A0A919QAZ2_9ACTN|nr:class E sortase [Acrocarpospora phusangensis]GIH23350.1 class E sortase [Acrocarpospora phusangensis]